MRRISDQERRHRLAVRHALAPAARRHELEAEAARLTDWLDGLRVGTVYPSPAMKDAREQVAAP